MTTNPRCEHGELWAVCRECPMPFRWPDPLRAPSTDDEPWSRHRVAPCADPECDICHDRGTGVIVWLGFAWVVGFVLLALLVALVARRG